MNGLNKAGIEINRKMLSELAIDNPASFKELVEVAKKALANGEKSSKKETTKEEKTEEKQYNEMSLTELKAVAKEKGIKGYSTMKKEELLENLK